MDRRGEYDVSAFAAHVETRPQFAHRIADDLRIARSEKQVPPATPRSGFERGRQRAVFLFEHRK